MKTEFKWSISRLLHQFISELDSALLTQCSLCQQDYANVSSKWNKLLCPDCFEQFITNQGLGTDALSPRYCCHQCGLPMRATGENSSDLICGQCLKNPLLFDYCQTLFDYQYPLQNWIAQIKHQQQMLIARKLSQLLAMQLQNTHPEHQLPSLIIPVPQSKARAKQLGFNPARVIAKQMGLILSIRVQVDWIIANPNHLPQKHLNAYQRMKNMANAFQFNPKTYREFHKVVRQHHNIAIVDDVVTTGATAGSLAKLLKENGAEEVGVWALARTPKPKQKGASA